jgi:hypothetical protein
MAYESPGSFSFNNAASRKIDNAGYRLSSVEMERLCD